MNCSRPGFPILYYWKTSPPEVWSNSCSLSQWCHLTILSSVAPFFSYPQSFPGSGFFCFCFCFCFPNKTDLCIRWPKFWSFSFCISPSSEYSGLIFYRIDWLDLFAVQGTLKSLLQHCSSKASIHQCPAVIMWAVQLPHPYMTTGKSIALTIRTFFAKVATLLFNHCLGYGRPLQCSCLEDPRDGGARWAAVYGAHRVGHDWRDLAAAAGWS